MKLISMTDFVLGTESNLDKYNPIGLGDDIQKRYVNIIKYAQFLKQPLTLGMFIPCDEDGNLIDVNNRHTSDYEHLNKELDRKYQQAKERVLFEGYVLIKDTRTTITIYNKYNEEELGFAKNKPSGEIIESWLSISFNPPLLTPQALKQIGL